MVELLAPAGNFQRLKIALHYGADAVYAGLSTFSLRTRSAKEFNPQSFANAIGYTHERGKKFYATVNGFAFNSQVDLYKKHLILLKDLKPDGIIVSTPGMVKLAKDVAPDIDVHLSTQANVLNYLDAQVYADLGVKRIIAARESSLKDLQNIKQKIPDLELEVFVHGSMCFAFSGRCLVSSLQTGRISNKGSCANDCRFSYTAHLSSSQTNASLVIEEDEHGSYVLNAKDLNMIEHVPQILQTKAISSLKIEGRTKSDYYVALATRSYRRAIDDFYAQKSNIHVHKDELDKLKNRGYFDGYLLKRPFEVDAQNRDFAISLSQTNAQVVAIGSEDGKSVFVKDRLQKGIDYEIICTNEILFEIDNEIGSIFARDGKYFVRFKIIQAINGKIFDEIHSGNLNAILLPKALEPFTILRVVDE